MQVLPIQHYHTIQHTTIPHNTTYYNTTQYNYYHILPHTTTYYLLLLTTTADPVEALSRELGFRVHRVPRTGLSAWHPPFTPPDAVLAAVSFGHRLPAPLLAAFPRAALNLHPSLLPRGRGAAPVEWTIARGEGAGVSVLEMLPHRFDAGRIWAQESLVSALVGVVGVVGY